MKSMKINPKTTHILKLADEEFKKKKAVVAILKDTKVKKNF